MSKIVEELKKRCRGASDSQDCNKAVGLYTLLEKGDRYKIKRIEVNPGARLSFQMHYHRSEHWVVVSGTAKVMRGESSLSTLMRALIYRWRLNTGLRTSAGYLFSYRGAKWRIS